MRIGLISDTHSNIKTIDQAVKLAGEIDLWLHAGDMIQDAEYLKEVYEVPVVNVAGNCDWNNTKVPDIEYVETAGYKIMLTHGHIFGVKRHPHELVKAALEKGADIAVYGHSHESFIQRIHDVLVINPGSLSFPRDGKPQSFMVLELQEGAEPEVFHYHL